MGDVRKVMITYIPLFVEGGRPGPPSSCFNLPPTLTRYQFDASDDTRGWVHIVELPSDLRVDAVKRHNGYEALAGPQPVAIDLNLRVGVSFTSLTT